ncbi:MAG: alpha/beta fold hydrolase [Chitinophagales bacterium]
MHSESLFAETADGEKLHLKRFYTDEDKPAVFLLHGSIENGKIFYSKSGKGLAPWLAKQGFDVFVGDIRGRGKSQPKISKHSKHGQWEIITIDIPVFLDKIRKIKGNVPVSAIAHSWGGVLLLAYIARHKNHPIDKMVFFGSKRRISVFNKDRLIKIDLVWNFTGYIISLFKGYFPAVEYNIGADNESRKYFQELNHWIYCKKWIDPRDGFDYNKALKSITTPPTLYLTGTDDRCLGHPTDVKLLMDEANNEGDQFHLLGKANGHKKDYGHIDTLTDPGAVEDIFPLVVGWLKKIN